MAMLIIVPKTDARMINFDFFKEPQYGRELWIAGTLTKSCVASNSNDNE